jgi:hypothetical protein
MDLYFQGVRHDLCRTTAIRFRNHLLWILILTWIGYPLTKFDGADANAPS